MPERKGTCALHHPACIQEKAMKLRIKGDTLRLRISPSEMGRLLETGRVEETIHFGDADDLQFTYALERYEGPNGLAVRYAARGVVVLIAGEALQHWGSSSDVGVYATLPAGCRTLDVAIEKDFACLDRSEAENRDSYPNPREGKAC